MRLLDKAQYKFTSAKPLVELSVSGVDQAIPHDVVRVVRRSGECTGDGLSSTLFDLDQGRRKCLLLVTHRANQLVVAGFHGKSGVLSVRILDQTPRDEVLRKSGLLSCLASKGRYRFAGDVSLYITRDAYAKIDVDARFELDARIDVDAKIGFDTRASSDSLAEARI